MCIRDRSRTGPRRSSRSASPAREASSRRTSRSVSRKRATTSWAATGRGTNTCRYVRRAYRSLRSRRYRPSRALPVPPRDRVPRRASHAAVAGALFPAVDKAPAVRRAKGRSGSRIPFLFRAAVLPPGTGSPRPRAGAPHDSIVPVPRRRRCSATSSSWPTCARTRTASR